MPTGLTAGCHPVLERLGEFTVWSAGISARTQWKSARGVLLGLLQDLPLTSSGTVGASESWTTNGKRTGSFGAPDHRRCGLTLSANVAWDSGIRLTHGVHGADRLAGAMLRLVSSHAVSLPTRLRLGSARNARYLWALASTESH